MDKLPSSISIMGQDIEIEHCESLLDTEECWGLWYAEKNLIRVQSPDERHPKDLCFQSYYHELVHAILDITGHDKLSKSEDFVERLSQAIYQAEKSRKE